jgi:hypothetical protein
MTALDMDRAAVLFVTNVLNGGGWKRRRGLKGDCAADYSEYYG